MTPTRISRPEWLTALLIAILATALLLLPYLLGHLLARPGVAYTGLLINLEDGTYLAAIQQGIEGHWLYRSPFTPEPHQPVFIQVFYLSVGHAARWLGLPAVGAWHISLAALDLLLFLTVYGFTALFLAERRQRLVAYLLILFAGGFDWWRFPLWLERPSALDVVPLDRMMPEAHPFYSALTYPHFVAGITLIVATLWLAYLALAVATGRRRWVLAATAAVANLLLAFVYPFLIILIALGLALFYLALWLRAAGAARPGWRGRPLLWREAGLLAVVLALPAPLYLYYATVLSRNPVMRQWSDQAVTLSPNPLHYLLAYLPFLLLIPAAVAWLRRLDARRRTPFLLLLAWLAAVCLLLYAPLNPQRRYVEGVQIPLAILATAGLFQVVLPHLAQTPLFRSLARRPRYSPAGLQGLVVALFLLLSSLIHIYLYATAVLNLAFVQPYPLFRPLAELEAMAWLKENGRAGDVVLADYWTGSYLPAQSGHRVVVGNRYETASFEQKLRQVAAFGDAATPDGWRQAWLAQHRVRYLFWGRAERRAASFDPAGARYLTPVFRNEEVIIYRVTDS